MPAPDSRLRRLEWSIFATLFVTYAYFFQGGGWNPNARFDQVRAIAETGSLSINAFLAYRAVPGDATGRLERVTVPPLEAFPEDRTRFNTWDLSLHAGRFHPNKPPGAVFLAVPGYLAAHGALNALGVPADSAWGLTLRAWLATLASVSLVGAAAGVVLLRTSRRLLPDIALEHHALAALTLGLGTLFLPFATTLMDHVIAATLLLAGFGLLVRGADAEPAPPGVFAAAGLAAGAAVLVNYTAALGLAALGAYALWRRRSARSLAAFAAGAAAPLALLAAYHQACFGSPLATANTYQAPGRFVSQGLWLGMLGVPDPRVVVQLTVSPFRGLFFSSPVLALGAWGLLGLARAGRRAEAVLCAGVAGLFLAVNASFNGWDGGNTFGPRYLIPAIPFLALGLPAAFARLPRTTRAAAVVSGALMLFATFVTPQAPRDARDPWLDFLLPIASGAEVRRGHVRFLGPVSANPAGVYEIAAYRTFGPASPHARWSAFNAGELLAPQSGWSALPLLAFLAVAIPGVRRLAAPRPGPEPAA